jgi:predicted small secreted protein
MIDRIRALPSRLLLLVGLGLVLVVLAASGILTADRDVEIERDEAITIAREHVSFEPKREEARIFRQGARLQPVWGVSFSVGSEESGPRDFERLTTVEIDAKTGEVLRVSVDDPDGD